MEFDAVLGLQQRLVYEAAGDAEPRVTLLVCEHSPCITVGRQGSWRHIRQSARELAARSIPIRWVNRGGGCLVHQPGQLAVYPIAPLKACGLSVGGFLGRLQSAVESAISELAIVTQAIPGRFGVWGRSGQLAAVGVAVKDWVTYYGAYINVSADMNLARWVESDPESGTCASSLCAERRSPVRMPKVREAVIRHLAASLGGPRFHLHSGHPWLPGSSSHLAERRARVG
jgi:lipoyl(octanoyl) transferase